MGKCGSDKFGCAFRGLFKHGTFFALQKDETPPGNMQRSHSCSQSICRVYHPSQAVDERLRLVVNNSP
ncbi:MAG: hypothetical protein CSA81_01950 [Acidobacteria bacterium]|nr:MAG: hypothetical protein CSA81_01950 [Acidobacteriota bacterium]